MTFEEFKNLAVGIQSVVISLGFLCGGAWALFRFRAFRENEKARVELEKLHKELKERGVIKILIDPSLVIHNTQKHIKLNIMFENTGNRSETLHWQRRSFMIYENMPSSA